MSSPMFWSLGRFGKFLEHGGSKLNSFCLAWIRANIGSIGTKLVVPLPGLPVHQTTTLMDPEKPPEVWTVREQVGLSKKCEISPPLADMSCRHTGRNMRLLQRPGFSLPGASTKQDAGAPVEEFMATVMSELDKIRARQDVVQLAVHSVQLRIEEIM